MGLIRIDAMPVISAEDARFAAHVVDHLFAHTRSIAADWLEEIKAQHATSPVRIFPDATLLNHIPQLLEALFKSVLGAGEPTDDEFVQFELQTLAKLRRAQGYTLDEIVAEFHALREAVNVEVRAACDTWNEPIAPRSVLEFSHELAIALNVIEQETGDAYRDATVADREERAELLSAFGRAITHELRNRLNNAVLSLSVYRQRLEADPGGTDSDTLLDRLGVALEHLDEVAADVFAALVSDGRLAATPGRRLAFDQLVRDTCDELSVFARQREVEIEPAPELPSFQIDAPRLHLVLVNFLTNSIKYSDPKKKRRWIRVRAGREAQPGRWRVEIEDNGIGMSEAFQKSAFRQYARASVSDHQPGEGLGLALAQEAVTQLGGSVTLTSKPGRGATFSFTLDEPDAEFTVASGRDIEDAAARR